jgi:hypothetical protein
MLAQQCAKLVMKTLKNIATKGHKAGGYFEYLNHTEKLINMKMNITSASELLNIQLLDDALAIRAASLASNCAQTLGTSKASENEKVNTLFSMELVKTARAHMKYVCF